MAQKSHRERIEEFNQKLTNMSEHYDIPKVCVCSHAVVMYSGIVFLCVYRLVPANIQFWKSTKCYFIVFMFNNILNLKLPKSQHYALLCVMLGRHR